MSCFQSRSSVRLLRCTLIVAVIACFHYQSAPGSVCFPSTSSPTAARHPFPDPGIARAVSALGQKQTFTQLPTRPALPPIADIKLVRVTFSATTPAAWQRSPQSAAGLGSEVKVYADNAASSLCIQLKTFSYSEERTMSGTEITQVMALSACVSAFVSLFLLAAFR
jgi:hypothetical protein